MRFHARIAGANTKLRDTEFESIRRKIRQLKKTDEKLKAALARLETDRILERLGPDPPFCTPPTPDFPC